MSKNFADATVLTAPSPATSGTSLTVQSGQGALLYTGKAFVSPVGVRPSASNSEVVTISGISGDTVTITRASESSTARTIVVGDSIFQGVTAATADDWSAQRSVTKTVGATGNYITTGTADQTPLNNAITAVNAAGGGIVHIQAGTYNLTGAINLLSNVTLQGEGDGTILKLANSIGTNVIKNTNTASLLDSNMKIERLQIHGNGVNQPVAPNNTGTGVDAVYFAFATNVTIADCYIHDGNRHNILFSDSCSVIRVTNNRLADALGLSNLSTFNVNDMVFSENICSGANETGVKNDQSHTVTISGNSFFNNTTHQIYVTNGTSTTITGNAARGGQTGIRVTSNDYVSITGNSLRSHSNNGITLLQNCNYIAITGNIIRDVGSATANTYDGINITDTSTGCTDIAITGNSITDTASKMRYGVYAGNNSDYISIANNNIKGYVTGRLSLAGSNNTTYINNADAGATKIINLATPTISTDAATMGYADTKAAKGANSDITSLSGLTTPLTVGQGGTGSATQNFVDLTTAQTIAGSKAFSNDTTINAQLGVGVSPTHLIHATKAFSTTVRALYIAMTGQATNTTTTLAQFDLSGTGAQNPQIILSSNTTAGLTIGHASSFGQAVINHIWSSATRLSLQLRSVEVIGMDNSGNVFNTGNLLTSGYLRVGSTTAPNNTTAGDITATRLTLGTNSAFSADRAFQVNGTATSTASGAIIFANMNPTIAPASASLSAFRVLTMQSAINPSATGVTLNSVQAGYFENRLGANADSTITTLQGVYGQGLTLDTSAVATPIVTNIYGAQFNAIGKPSGTSVVSTSAVVGVSIQAIASAGSATVSGSVKGIYILDNGATNTIPTNIGIDIAAMATGSTANYGIRVAKASGATTNAAINLSDTTGVAGGGILFGTDTTLYRSTTTTLKTDNTLIVGTPGTTAGSAATIDGTQTLTNKTISGASNTLSSIGVSSLSATGTPSSTTYLRGDGTWSTPAGSGSGITRSITSIAANTTAGATASTDYVYFISGTTTLTLPTAVSNTNRYTVKNTGTATVTIATTSSQTIDGSTTLTLTPGESRDILSDNANWRIV